MTDVKADPSVHTHYCLASARPEHTQISIGPKAIYYAYAIATHPAATATCAFQDRYTAQDESVWMRGTSGPFSASSRARMVGSSFATDGRSCMVRHFLVSDTCHSYV